MVDHQHVHGSLGRHESSAELFLNGLKYAGSVWLPNGGGRASISRGWPRRRGIVGRKLEVYLEVTRNAGLVDNGTIQDKAQQAGEHRERASLEVNRARRHEVPTIVLAGGQRGQGMTYKHGCAVSIL